MKKMVVALLLSFISVAALGSCGASENSDEKEFIVTWKNDNGDILEVDEHVKEGTEPHYDSETPTKEGDNQYQYTFLKWEPEVHAIYENTTFTATYTKAIRTYTVTWVNDNNEVLEIDNNVPYGSMPSYDGKTPQKEKNGDTIYIFSGWTPTLHSVESDQTYKANYIEKKEGELEPGIDPVLLEDGKTIQYGFYPQVHIQDEALITQLNQQKSFNENGWYLYENHYYVKETAAVFKNEAYTFDDGEAIVSGMAYWFECKPIEWQILNQKNGTYLLLSKYLLDAQCYYENYDNRVIDGRVVSANNYEKSEIRTWLNSTFYNQAFLFNANYIQKTLVNNDALSTDDSTNPYASNSTNDAVFLPSYQDYLNIEFGFENDATQTSSTRVSKVTDYARAKGAWMNEEKNGSYWTRSPASEFNYCAWNVNSGGYLSSYAVDGNSHCVRPCIAIFTQI